MNRPKLWFPRMAGNTNRGAKTAVSPLDCGVAEAGGAAALPGGRPRPPEADYQV